jgi:ADP-ribose pyrophosphatase YjhB (NUDIX family)
VPTAEQQEMGEFQDVVTVFLTHRSKILVLKRSREVGTYKGHWAGVSGYLESEEGILDAVGMREHVQRWQRLEKDFAL